MRIVRENAVKWNINENKIVVMGFSAYGYLASTLGTYFQDELTDYNDAIELQSSRLDFMVLKYPVISITSSITHNGSKNNLLGTET